MTPLSAWANFYVIVGSAAAALIGVQFVVIALVANMRRPTSHETIGAFGTPTLVHLGGALVLSAVMSAPWPSLVSASVVLALCGIGGLAYGAVVILRARRQTVYQPVWEDWLWHAILPCSVYAALTLAGLCLRTRSQVALFLVGGAVLVLLLIGIHNAWDTVTYMVVAGQSEDPNAPVAAAPIAPAPPDPTAPTR